MLKRSLYGFTISLMLWVGNAQAEYCSPACRAGGMACMRACIDTFKDDKKCGIVCEYTDKTCAQTCVEASCKEDCVKSSGSSIDVRSCTDRCEVNGKGWLEKWLEKPIVK